MVSVKIEGSSKKGADVRRVCVEDLPRENKSEFQTVASYVQTVFSSSHFVLKYKDDEGDLVTVASETEFQEALRVAALAKRCLKLYLVDVPAPKPKNETSVEVLTLDPQISDPLHLQFQLRGQTRDLIISKSTIGISTIREKALTVFPELKSKDFSLKYLDDEGDAVTMTEIDELQDALQLLKEDSIFIIVVSLNTPSVPIMSSPWSSSEPANNDLSLQSQGSKKKWKKKKKGKKRSNGKMLPGMI